MNVVTNLIRRLLPYRDRRLSKTWLQRQADKTQLPGRTIRDCNDMKGTHR